ncbi:MAG: YHYH protein [Bryobacteraceae bacterium]|nr:YHYH protein [Bryobacteraceae bacterium]
MLAQPVSTVWIRTQLPANVSRRPDVHAVEVTEREVVVRSHGFSLAPLGLLASPPAPPAVTGYAFRIPRQPQPAAGRHAHVPSDATGVFVNGVPVYNHFEAASYRGQNLWHYDLVARNDDGTSTVAGRKRADLTHPTAPGLLERLAVCAGGKHSPLIGFAFDGYPIYGPCTTQGPVRSGYRLRDITVREVWPDGTVMAPGQAGPPVSDEYPLGTFVEDYVYVAGAGALDRYNGRFAATPEYPQGTYAYYLSTEGGKLAFPYLLAHEYQGEYASETFRPSATAGIVSLEKKNDSLRFQIDSPTPIRYLEFVHERPLHLLIISEDLQDFAHLHPEVNPQGTWETTYSFPRPGRYRLYADFTPPGGAQRVTQFDLLIPGKPTRPAKASIPAGVELDRTRPWRAGEDTQLRFTLNLPGLEPYLGAWAHVVIVGEGLSSFLHAHPLEASPIAPSEAHIHTREALGPPPREVSVAAVLPRAGRYKLWLQTQSAGTVLAIPFEIEVSAAQAKTPVSTVIPPGAIRVQVTPEGFVPARVTAPPGKAFTLALTRSSAPNCGNTIVIPALGISRDLPLGATILIELPPHAQGALSFSCGMGMYRGSLVIGSEKN